MDRTNNNVFNSLFWVVVAAVIMVFAATPVLAQEVSPEGNVLAVAPACCLEGTSAEDNVSVTVYADIVSGRDFPDQGFSLTGEPVTEFGITACSGAWCVDLWRAESLSGNVADHETDLAIFRTDTIGGFTVETKVAFFELEGPEVWDAKLTVSHPIGERCEASASYEVMWAGFNDHVTKGELSCSFPTSVERLTVDVSGAVAYSTWASSVTPMYQLGLGYELRPGLTASFYLKGYEGESDQNILFGVGIARTW